MSVHKEVKRVTTHVLAEMKLHGEKIFDAHSIRL